MKLTSTAFVAVLTGAMLGVGPSAAADATLVEAVASLDASPDHGDSDETGDVSFTDLFSDSVSATWSEEGLESASGTQTTSIDLGAGKTLIGFSTEANVDSAASGGPDDRACCATGEATLASVYPAARDHLNFPELWTDERLEPWKVRQVLLTGVEEPNLWLDVAETFDTGLAAICAHVSQVDPDEVGERMRERARLVGEPQGIGLAQAFLSIQLDR